MANKTPLERKLAQIEDNHDGVTRIAVQDGPLYKGQPKHVQVDFEPHSLDMVGVDDIPDDLDADMEDAGFEAITGQMSQAVYKDVKYSDD